MPLVVSPPKKRVILGLMTFGTHPEQGARITDLDAFNEALDIFQQRGYNEVDTARTYVGGTQEAFTKAARWKERGLTLATKVQYPNQPGDNTAAKVVASVETSLRELGTDCVDVSFTRAMWKRWRKLTTGFRPDRSCTCTGRTAGCPLPRR